MNGPVGVVIPVGGRASRTDPVPKLLLKLGSNQSLAQATGSRHRKFAPLENTLVVTSQLLSWAIREESAALNDAFPDNIIVEPRPRDTALAIATATTILEARLGADGAVIVAPGDHVIPNADHYQKTVETVFAQGFPNARCPFWTLGIKPTQPSEDFGHIELGARVSKSKDSHLFSAERFIEKPRGALARELFARATQRGDILWNSGIFLFHLGTLNRSFAEVCPKGMASLSQAATLHPMNGGNRDEFQAALDVAFNTWEDPRSVDLVVMEKASKRGLVYCGEAGFAWEDVGHWKKIADYLAFHEPSRSRYEGEFHAREAYAAIAYNPGAVTMVIGPNADNLLIAKYANQVRLYRADQTATDLKAFVKELPVTYREPKEVTCDNHQPLRWSSIDDWTEMETELNARRDRNTRNACVGELFAASDVRGLSVYAPGYHIAVGSGIKTSSLKSIRRRVISW